MFTVIIVLQKCLRIQVSGSKVIDQKRVIVRFSFGCPTLEGRGYIVGLNVSL